MLDHREELGLRIVVVAFADAKPLRRYQQGLGLEDVLVLSDPDHQSYAVFGFPRGSVRRVWLDPRVWWRYGTLLARGRRPARAQQDSLQLGGDVLVDDSGRVRWIHRSRGPEDRPRLAVLAAQARAAARPAGARAPS